MARSQYFAKFGSDTAAGLAGTSPGDGAAVGILDTRLRRGQRISRMSDHSRKRDSKVAETVAEVVEEIVGIVSYFHRVSLWPCSMVGISFDAEVVSSMNLELTQWQL